MRVQTTNGSAIVKSKKYSSKNGFKLFLIAVPFIIYVIAFAYVPLFGWMLAFIDYKPGIGLAKSPFVGLKFFKLIFSDSHDLLNAIKNTLGMNFLIIICSPLPAIFAIFLSEVKNKHIKKIIQTTTTLPYFVSWVIVFSMFFSLFSTEGIINHILLELNIVKEPTMILSNVNATWFVQVGLHIWKVLGYNSIIYLAAIAGIDNELFDAAKVDGASRIETILHITVPGILETYLVLLLLSISNMLSNDFNQYFVFYNPVIANNIEVLDYYTYRVGIGSSDFSFATAIGMSKTVISVIMLFTANFISKKIRGNTIV